VNDKTTDKRAKFEKYSKQRLQQAASAIERFSAPSYEWTPDEVAAMARDLKARVDAMLDAFKSRRAWKTLGGK
jgi:hypothetical protein